MEWTAVRNAHAYARVGQDTVKQGWVYALLPNQLPLGLVRELVSPGVELGRSNADSVSAAPFKIVYYRSAWRNSVDLSKLAETAAEPTIWIPAYGWYDGEWYDGPLLLAEPRGIKSVLFEGGPAQIKLTALLSYESYVRLEYLDAVMEMRADCRLSSLVFAARSLIDAQDDGITVQLSSMSIADVVGLVILRKASLSKNVTVFADFSYNNSRSSLKRLCQNLGVKLLEGVVPDGVLSFPLRYLVRNIGDDKLALAKTINKRSAVIPQRLLGDV